MRNLKTCLLLLVLLAFTNMQCEKTEKEDKLPEKTQVGKNTFGCLVDGEVWLPRTSSYHAPLKSSFSGNILDIEAIRGGGESIGIVIRNFDGVKNYSLNSGAYLLYGKGSEEFEAKKFSVSITTFDLKNRIVSGTFEYEGVNSQGVTVIIKDGRFDLKFT